jgi:hypothetical protein
VSAGGKSTPIAAISSDMAAKSGVSSAEATYVSAAAKAAGMPTTAKAAGMPTTASATVSASTASVLGKRRCRRNHERRE